ncbi:RNA polymerase sigma factor [Galbibacter sp.]|uniref:RNA polymerase sigma factor n=1 Tax=Galbibacter sp. TaxID=2918471 RepID=UPI002C25407C|nr:RNA polymerase sigma factor [Galbibacter sp.]HLV61862.1 RNA polymerase sigma factor [Galbibacter sp.]
MSQQELHINPLIKDCIDGKQSAQLAIYNRYYKAMYNTALRIVKDPYEAEDVMQESFLNAFSKLYSYRAEVTFGAWLKRIVINNSIQQYRKSTKVQHIALDNVLYRVQDNDIPDSEASFTNLKAQEVLQTMKLLKDNYRIALTLKLVEGYDNQEICQIMSISDSSCRTLISRAKESLRKKLNGKVYETKG